MIPWWLGLIILVAGARIGYVLAEMKGKGRSDPRD